ncbi:MAG: pyridoxamine kinase [Clostridia bacterium]|jgi:pyridoxine kinase|nr:pyridoxamine kinase [Clostridia bacterium]MBR2849832.1 pyridoxamine kinase [Clostridia bacterium]
MSYKKILTIQDISCVGQCSLTVALPIISACGVETCVLPSAVLSTHTAGFKGYTFRDLTDDMPDIRAHWEKEGIKFDAIYTGYLGSTKQIDYVKDIFASGSKEGTVTIVDPAMADNGKLYPAFDEEYVEAMKGLCASADFIVPNMTEAALLAGMHYEDGEDRRYVDKVMDRLIEMGCKNIILKGLPSKNGNYIGILMYVDGKMDYYEHEKLPNSCHGTGDVYASAFVGALMRGKSANEAARIAAEYAMECIKETAKLDNHWYGAAFELALPKLIEMLK